jgi:transcriptional regulator with XRE-family HTH domain
MIGKRMKEARKKANLRQSDIAVKIGVAINTISDYETGKTRVYGEHLYKYALACGMTVDELLGTGAKGPESMEEAISMLPGKVQEAAKIIAQLSEQEQDRALRLLEALKSR